MNAKLKKDVLVNLGWLCGVPLALGLLVAASAMQLNAEKSRLADLKRQVAGKEASLQLMQAQTVDNVDRAALESALSESVDMIASESRRVSLLSDTAQRSGVTFVAIRSLDQELRQDGRALSVSHELEAVGSYSELGQFFSRLHDAPGVIGIEGFEIDRDEDASGDELRASLTVTWFGTNLDTPTGSGKRTNG